MRYFSRTSLLFGLLLLSLPPGIEAGSNKDGRISGIIKSVSGDPLADAVVRIFRDVRQGHSLIVTKTNGQGFFKSNLTPGIYFLQISHQGYQPVTTTKFVIDAGRTASLDIVLQEFIGLLSNEEDPRNWDMKTVMRSTSDRRMIFRDQPGVPLPEIENRPFYRNGAMNIASGTGYLTGPQASQNGISSNFAFAEPVSRHSRMILSGQLDFGREAFWRVRNTYNYRPNRDHDYRISAGYGTMNVNYAGLNPISQRMLSQDTVPASGVRALAIGVEGSRNFMDIMAFKYGFDYSMLHCGGAKSFFYPSLEILIQPVEGWDIQTSFTSRRVSDRNSVVLPDGEVLNLVEPTIITMVDGRVSMTQIQHSEVAARRKVDDKTALEFAVYQDRAHGPGLPVMVTTVSPSARSSKVMQMDEDQSSQRGVRVTLKRKMADNLSASVAYVYGDSVGIVGADGIALSEQLKNLSAYLQQRNQHSVTGRVDAAVPATGTRLLATVRWYSGNPLTPVDWFSDRMDIGTKSANFEIRQMVPLPEFIESAGRWEILVDLRNVLNQGREVLPTSDGEIVLNRNPRSMRFGLNLSFR